MSKIYFSLTITLLLVGNIYLFAQKGLDPQPVLTPTITCDSVLQTSTCAGGNVIIPFKVAGGSYNLGNVFTAQLSSNFGAFTTPINIGSSPINLGFIFATIPASVNFGIYKVRIITSNPKDTSNASPNFIIISQVAQLNQIVATPHNYLCPGDSITLTALNFANSYAWSTGATSSAITVGQAGIYSVTTTDALTCKSTAYDTLIASPCTGISENNWEGTVSVFPNPSRGLITVDLGSNNGDTKLELYNMVGDRLQALNFKNPNFQINLSAQPRGIYFLKISKKDGSSVVKKLVKE